MKRRNKKKPVRPKAKLGLPDLEQAKASVIGSLPSPGSQREYRRAIDEFVGWYCSGQVDASASEIGSHMPRAGGSL